MKTYKRITYTDRLKIETMYNAKIPVRIIADTLDFTQNAIYYELQKGFYMHRNSDLTETKKYSCDKAQMKTEYELTSKGAQLKLGNDYEFINFVETKIKEKYSPGAIIGMIRRENMSFKTNICRVTLYSYIDKGLFLNVTNKDLLRKGKNKKKYKKVRAKKAPAGTSIEKRPKYIEERKEFGHWELDTVIASAALRRSTQSSSGSPSLSRPRTTPAIPTSSFAHSRLTSSTTRYSYSLPRETSLRSRRAQPLSTLRTQYTRVSETVWSAPR